MQKRARFAKSVLPVDESGLGKDCVQERFMHSAENILSHSAERIVQSAWCNKLISSRLLTLCAMRSALCFLWLTYKTYRYYEKN